MYDSKSTDMLPGVQANPHSDRRTPIAGLAIVIFANLPGQTSGLEAVSIVHVMYTGQIGPSVPPYERRMNL